MASAVSYSPIEQKCPDFEGDIGGTNKQSIITQIKDDCWWISWAVKIIHLANHKNIHYDIYNLIINKLRILSLTKNKNSNRKLFSLSWCLVVDWVIFAKPDLFSAVQKTVTILILKTVFYQKYFWLQVWEYVHNPYSIK